MKTIIQLHWIRLRFAVLLSMLIGTPAFAQLTDTFATLRSDTAAGNLTEMWGDFDPQAEPLQTETLAEWEEEGVELRVVRFRIGVFKGEPASIAAVYGWPKGKTNLPGLLQIHGGGQYADAKACIANARRGYATVSIAWAGRISSSKYSVNSDGVKLFWENKTDDPNFRRTTDWGAIDGYHAPSRHPGNAFPSASPHPWTMDSIESPRNSGWFLCAVAARRALTFLEQQSEVDKDRLGVYGHSMGGKLTVLTATDPRVKAAAPSCGGISDRYNKSELFRNTLGDDVSLREIKCPIVFLSPANDFHGRIVDLPETIKEIQSSDWRVTCSPQHNHQDTAAYEVATLLWFDQHLRHAFTTPVTPQTNLRLPSGGAPSMVVSVDESMPVLSVDVFYSQHGKQGETPSDREFSMSRFWHHVKPTQVDGKWIAEMPISSTDAPLLAYANVSYQLDEPVSGAGYYYGNYTTEAFNLSSLVSTVWEDRVVASGVIATLKPTTMIESFEGEWEKEWYTYNLSQWPRMTNKLHDAQYAAPADAQLSIDVLSQQPNELVVVIDEYLVLVSLAGGDEYQSVSFSPGDFKNFCGDALSGWDSATLLKLSNAERMKPGRGNAGKPRVVGTPWQGTPPLFRNLRWTTIVASQSRTSNAD